MFFLLRAAFWLGLVFVALPWDGAALRSDLADTADAASKAAAHQAQAWCLKDPLACAESASAAARLIASPTPDAAREPQTRSQNTLMPIDLAPQWRGHATQLAPHQPPLPPRRPG